MATLKVELADRSYPIIVGSGLLGDSEILQPFLKNTEVMIITNNTVAPLYLDKVCKLLKVSKNKSQILSDGESFKNFQSLQNILDNLLENRFSRNATLVALGGGVIGDLVGFAAACYQRGVNFIQIPTTLLAQVDSSVGGKTGINHPLGKNMIGAFHQTVCVIADTETLLTLDSRQLSAGIAEIIKYGLIRDEKFFDWLEENIDLLMHSSSEALEYAIIESCRHKSEIVALDERESGQRALLNLGHTFGHAIEAASGYGKYLHGEAVAIGMVMAARMSRELGWIQNESYNRIVELLIRSNLPTTAPKDIPLSSYKKFMSLDKKVSNGRIRLVLLKSIGSAEVVEEYPDILLDEILQSSA